MQVIVDGLMAHYERSGAGLTLLILPGWADTSVSWLPVQKKLAGSFDVIILDIPGFGGSQMPPGTWGLDEMSRFIGHFLEKLSIKELYAVIGHSNGGAIAIHGLAAGSFKADKLILAAAAGIRGTDKVVSLH